MTFSNAAKKFRHQEILAASPEELVVKVYSALLADLMKAQRVMQQIVDDRMQKKVPQGPLYEERTKHLNRATDLLMELKSAVDTDQGGVIAENLNNLYVYFLSELQVVTRDQDLEKLKAVIEMVTSLHDSYKEAAKSL